MTNEATSISFQALSGAKNECPFAYLLHIDEYTILLDCGWSDSFDPSELSSLIDCCTRIDAVLISHPCIEHIGALPYLCQHHGLSAPIYATYPVSSLGAYLMYDHYCNKLEEGNFNLFSASDIRRTFDSIETMTYQQECTLGENIIITPYKAGRSIGGAVWRIVKGQNEIIYSNSIYNGNDRHLGGFDQAVISQWHPTLWIVDARADDRGGDEKAIETRFFKPIFDKLNDNKIVLFPVDGLARTLEVLIHLNDEWIKRNIQAPIYFLSHSSSQIYNAVNQLTEWLNRELTEKVLSTIESPFELKSVHFINEIGQIPNLGREGCVILATSDTLERGFSRQLFLKHVGKSTNLIFFTTKEPEGSLAKQLMSDNTHRDLNLIEKYREPLTGQELFDYKTKKEMEHFNQNIRMSESDTEGDSDNSEENNSTQQLTMKSRFQFTCRKKAAVTDYGAQIDPSEYAKGVQHAVLHDKETKASVTTPVVARSFLEEPEEVPSKLVENKIVFHFVATSRFYSFDARTNFFTLQQFLKKASPSHVIIIGSTLEQTMKLHDVIKDNINTIVSTPSVGETVYLTHDQSSMKIGLSRALYSRLDFKKYDEHNEVAYIDAILATDDISGLVSAKPVEVSQPHHANFVGKIDMPNLRQRLNDAGIKHTGKGKLVCGPRKVEVRQVSENALSVEGPMCADFIKIRNIIQDMLPMI
ncbi:hypothetical protein TRFO_31289 [Tritrichomonas foetus]|uniref:Cleavage and polyadenylation specificity factor subunit 2 n=1 Tax=Tritrichomonas foetus TaxID=1144522 RepID=A0A1J4JW70_9EUKA|nr:hypothetical protein TRFO_31289 [Tritrichomonas foetus]|eukprot:OHT01772.1 hypothetical protein TRFO_31289 [Tritrichomonas foetus]